MYKSARLARKTIPSIHKLSASSIRPRPRQFFSTTSKSNQKVDLREMWGLSKMSVPNKDIPRHEMAYFKDLVTSRRGFGDFRRVLFTGLYSQLVVMAVPVGGEIGDEVHTVDQVLIFTSGNGLATVAGRDQHVGPGDVVVVPAGTQHQFVTKGDKPLELITVYSPAEHQPTTVHKTKEEGDQEEDKGIDEAPEWTGKSKKENEAASW
ncbi:hypothetical protein E2P81_ATG02869 [Venturia nashicola]|nr:hypothetical protein E2P81_ATG02869 [Venturia nashicola]